MSSNIVVEPRCSSPLADSTGGRVPQTNTHPHNLTWWMVLLVVWITSGLYTAHLLKRGWVPMDEGTIGQSAERVLHGELPHHDFTDPYTGGLAYLNALSFSVLGTNSVSPRIVIFVFFMAFVPAVFLIASRFTSPLGAAGATLLSVAWSLPNYTAALPSWYNLFFAAFGALATLRFLETNRRIWIFLAGLCGGLSCLFKIIGLYFVGAVCLTLVFRELCISYEKPAKTAGRAYPIFLKMLFVALTSVLFLLLTRYWSVIAVVQFVLPGLALIALCLRRDSMRPNPPSAIRFRTLLQTLAPFFAGVILPIALFLIPFIRSGSLREFLVGVFVLPLRRFDFVLSTELPGIKQVVTYLTLCGLFAAAMYLRQPLRWPMRWMLVAALLLCSIAAPRSAQVYQLVWGPLKMMIPLCVLGGVLLLSSERGIREIPPLRQQQIVLFLAAAALCSLVQVPFGAPIYFCYTAPLLVLALAGLLSAGECKSGFLVGSLAVFYLAFAVFWFTPTFIFNMGHYYLPDRQVHRLTLARAGGLRVAPKQGEIYEKLIPIVMEHANGSQYVYCAPDCPEVPFLSGLRNPTRTLFDFLENPAGHSQRILEAIDSHEMKVVVIALDPIFSKPMPEDLQAALRQRFPEALRIGDFEVRWRN